MPTPLDTDKSFSKTAIELGLKNMKQTKEKLAFVVEQANSGSIMYHKRLWMIELIKDKLNVSKGLWKHRPDPEQLTIEIFSDMKEVALTKGKFLSDVEIKKL